ncbi:SGNH/GDSL hydrolase family protein [Arthrobacter sp. zg-Y820]|uniref:SGNH/GDSL hydrolase family protein n=1 Tax=unclassified Arthrobacter TaxID=235627 RepID=UPI001E34C5D0|nr:MULTISPECIES: SGNH/GDSL hydrolase family protein [unclassified Arthrobacter]MCC9196523.1 SGNH/GDSL hydrolase family protein [Arthrobacter sp. zg-Y820]MDK1279385.1 SGNH/GDSL hydrolase family protein [Arthrobacter sp. zg.Y820]MDK1358995.1 SGNH/GDSL hydrolase family protein [Arthrobacter sp. zg-Y1219]WIB08232.1 SGNH/GDSL hydrolase family protein [Arthrobacter sp. zg-Y820]
MADAARLFDGHRIVFAGDSVTDCDRLAGVGGGLGDGYVRLLAESASLAGAAVVNRGVGGDRIEDLARRWDAEVLAETPQVVSVMIGINDTWRRYDAGQKTDEATFLARYRALLERLAPDAVVVLMEPFLLPVTAEQQTWRQDLDPKIAAVRRLAKEFGAVLVRTDEVLNSLVAAGAAPESLADDGVHPTAQGHAAIAEAWLDAVCVKL